eukprot:973068-Pyramimonas_sp.AAC.1
MLRAEARAARRLTTVLHSSFDSSLSPADVRALEHAARGADAVQRISAVLALYPRAALHPAQVVARLEHARRLHRVPQSGVLLRHLPPKAARALISVLGRGHLERRVPCRGACLGVGAGAFGAEGAL